MDNKEQNFFESNLESWNKRVKSHVDSDFYDVEGFKKNQNSLNEIELNELGDVQGKSLLHLQCHFGMDTLSWASKGAKATGVDFSQEAISMGKKLNKELKLDAEFVCSDVYGLRDNLNEKFDIVFTSYGVIGWLPDMDTWASIVAHFLKPGGTFYMAEFHPFIWMLDDDFKNIHYAYFNTEVIATEQQGTYADRDAKIELKEYSWNHSISEVVNALLKYGLKIELLNEYDYSPYDCFPNTVKNEDGNFYIQGYEKILPMIYTIKATK